jgi:hypothetical protein
MNTSTNGMSATGLTALRELLLADGGLMGTLLADEQQTPTEASAAARIAASGPRAAHAPHEYELLVEAIYEGYLLHYGKPRVVRVPEADLRLLAGDRLYAIGLARLVALGDTPAVSELADTITLSALAQAAGSVELAQAIWLAGAGAVGWGASESHQQAKELVRAGSPQALAAMRTSAATSAAPS